jgi:hypothetical protein
LASKETKVADTQNVVASDFDQAVAWTREALNRDENKNLKINFEIWDARTGASKMAYSDLIGRLGVTTVKIALCPKGIRWEGQYCAHSVAEYEEIISFILSHASLYQEDKNDGLSDCLSLDTCSL